MKYGYFDNEAREYVITRVDLPTSWTNYLGVEDTCVVLNHTAGGYMFYKSPEYHRITRFHANSVPMDRPGHYIYIRDNKDGDYWSLSWQPVGKPLDLGKYTCRHGLSYSKYECEYKGIYGSQTMSVPIGEQAEVWDIQLENRSEEVRTLSLFSYCEFSYHQVMLDQQNFQMSNYCAGIDYEDGVLEYDLFYEEYGYQYMCGNFKPDGYDGVRDQFIGPYRSEDCPRVVEQGKCKNSTELGGNHCGCLNKNMILQPGEQIRLAIFLGEGRREEGQEIRKRYQSEEQLDHIYSDLKEYWDCKLQCLQIETPNKGMNTMINCWTLYQSEINVMFSRFASFIEVGGRVGLGYRDTAQDAMTVIHSNPTKCRERIGQLMQGLTSAGYGLHLFQPEWFEETKEKEVFQSPTVIPKVDKKSIVHGIEDACSDDALWLVTTVVDYIKETGEVDYLRQRMGYADGGSGSVYEHLKRILDFSTRSVGKTGIGLGLRADWNDCLNLGGGESAMVSFLHYWALDNFIALAGFIGEEDDVRQYQMVADQVKQVCEKQLWDGKWYIRGITKTGRKIGTQVNKEGKIHLESNAWAVLSGAAGKERGLQAMDSVKRYLSTPYGIRLNAPSYREPDDEVGFVTRVYPGVKENGSIFSHPNPWAWAAECKLGRGNQAMDYYNALCPYYQNDQIEVREAEPYSYCQFIMGPDHTAYGRARHPFMTGSGGWAYYSATKYMLGIQPDFEQLIVDPCIPGEWEEFKVQRVWRKKKYHIVVENPCHVMKGVREIYLNGKRVEEIKASESLASNEVRVVLGVKDK